MKILFLAGLLATSSTYADTFLIKGFGAARNRTEEVARGEAIKAAKKEAKNYANWTCWSAQGKGVLSRDFAIEVISQDMVDHFYAQATAMGEFRCGPVAPIN